MLDALADLAVAIVTAIVEFMVMLLNLFFSAGWISAHGMSFRGTVQAIPLRRMLDEYLTPLPAPVTLARLEVGGPTPVAAAINLETVLRLAFAQPNINGIYFAGLLADDLLEDNAALLDAQGEPTAPGAVLDAFFTEVWTSDERGVTDERGNVSVRVFTGWHTVTATLPDGTVLKTEVYVPKSDRAKLIVLQATAAEASP